MLLLNGLHFKSFTDKKLAGFPECQYTKMDSRKKQHSVDGFM